MNRCSNPRATLVSIGLVDRAQEAYVFNQNGAFIASPIAVAQRGDKASGVHFQKRLGLLVWVYLDVLVWDIFQLQRHPHALHEGASVGSVMIEAGPLILAAMREPTRSSFRIISSPLLWNGLRLWWQPARWVACGMTFGFGQTWL